MRFLLPLLLLVGLMAAASAWQGHWTDGMRRQRDVLLGRAAPVQVSTPTRVVIGRPSGQAPFDVPWERPSQAPPPAASPASPGAHEPPRASGTEQVPPASAPWEPVFEIEVRPGKVLSVLCQEFYGTSRPVVVQRVAEWNRLASPDHLKAGQLLELPARAWILDGVP